jgi:AraC-like DNA-binding protein
MPVDGELYTRLLRSRDLLASQFTRPLTLHDASREACLSPYHFQRLFRRAFHETPHDFLTRRRLEQARRLLANGASVTETCLESGYLSLGSFSSRFQKATGLTPSEYQRVMRTTFGYRAPWRVRFIPTCYLLALGVPIGEKQDWRSLDPCRSPNLKGARISA